MSASYKLVNQVADVLEDVLISFSRGNKTVPLHEPTFAGNEWSYVKNCLDTGWVSSVGKYVDDFEERLADYTGVKHAVSVMNGTAALHTCLILAGVQPSDEVIMPALTFVATANAIAYTGGIPHFVDCEVQSLGIDASKLDQYLQEEGIMRSSGLYNKRTGRRIKAIVVMHTYGHSSHMSQLLEVADRYELTIIEDAAESLGSYYNGQHTGNFGLLAAVSFNGNKVITAGGGGAILTNDGELAAKAKHLTTTAKIPHPWMLSHDTIGYNYRMPNLNAALGCAQLEQLPTFLAKKRMLANTYKAAFASVDGVRFLEEPTWGQSNYWLNTIILESPDLEVRNQILEETNRRGIMTRPAWQLMHQLPMYANCPRMDLSTVERLVDAIINIPSGAALGGNADA